MLSCSQCGYNMEPLDTVCRKCKGQGVANTAAAPPQPAANPWQQQAPPLNPTNQMGSYQRPDYVPQPQRSGFRMNGSMIYGGLACLFGIVATAVGYFTAAPGKSYTLFWGAIIFGGIRFFRGLTQD